MSSFQRLDHVVGSYYMYLGRTDYYNADGEGKLMQFFNEQEYNDDSLPIDDELGRNCDPHDCCYTDFDNKFPIPIEIDTKGSYQREAFVFFVLQYCYQHGQSPSTHNIKNVFVSSSILINFYEQNYIIQEQMLIYQRHYNRVSLQKMLTRKINEQSSLLACIPDYLSKIYQYHVLPVKIKQNKDEIIMLKKRYTHLEKILNYWKQKVIVIQNKIPNEITENMQLLSIQTNTKYIHINQKNQIKNLNRNTKVQMKVLKMLIRKFCQLLEIYTQLSN